MSKPLIIKTANATRLKTALDAAQGRAQVNLETIETLAHHADQAELILDTSRVPRADRAGAVYTHTPEGPSRSYRYGQGATSIRLVRLPGGWALESAERVELYPKTAAKRVMLLTREQKYAAVAAFAAWIGLGNISAFIAAAGARGAIDAVTAQSPPQE